MPAACVCVADTLVHVSHVYMGKIEGVGLKVTVVSGY